MIICINIFLYFVIFLDTDDHTDEARHGSALTAEDLKMVGSLKKNVEEKKADKFTAMSQCNHTEFYEQINNDQNVKRIYERFVDV